MNLSLQQVINMLKNIRQTLAKPGVQINDVGLYDVLTELKMATSRPVQQDSHLGQEIDKTIMADRLALVYQPQVELIGGKIIGFEALLRLDTDLLRNVPAGIFIPLLEKSDLILKAGEWVIENVCRQRREWHDNGVLALDSRIAINLSARQFSDKRLYDLLCKSIIDNEILPSMIEIEITESMLMEDTDHTRSTIKALRDLGVALSVDDFGTGYSSLAYLNQFHVDALKIDQYFLQHIATNSTGHTIAAAVIKLAHRLGLKTIAEGVEHESQLLILRSLNCDFAQGHMFSRPLPAEEVMNFVIQWRSENLEQRGCNPQHTLV